MASAPARGRSSRCGERSRALVANLLQVREIFGDELSHSVMFRDLLVEQVTEARSLSAGGWGQAGGPGS